MREQIQPAMADRGVPTRPPQLYGEELNRKLRSEFKKRLPAFGILGTLILLLCIIWYFLRRRTNIPYIQELLSPVVRPPEDVELRQRNRAGLEEAAKRPNIAPAAAAAVDAGRPKAA